MQLVLTNLKVKPLSGQHLHHSTARLLSSLLFLCVILIFVGIDSCAIAENNTEVIIMIRNKLIYSLLSSPKVAFYKTRGGSISVY